MRGVVVLLGSLLVIGCQADKAAPPAPAPPAGSASTPLVDARAGSAAGSAPAPTAEPTHVTLPRSPSTPPNRTTRPLARKELERLSAFEFKDFERQERGTFEGFTEFRHTTTTRPKLGVTITIERCGQAAGPPANKKPAATNRQAAAAGRHQACATMELDAWKAKGDELKRFLSPELVARPDTRFEVGAHDLVGAPAIYTVQLGAFFGKDERDQPVGAYSDAYILYYNDGVNQIRVNASYLDDPVGGIDQLVAIAPPEDLEKLAVAFMRFYLHEWR